MKRHLALLVALVCVAYGTPQVFARGGGHGGHHGGGHHGGGHHGGAHHGGAQHHSGHHHGHHPSHHDHHHHTHHGHHGGWGGGGWGGWGGAWGGWGAGWGLGWGAAWAPVAYGTAASWIGSPAATNVYTADRDAESAQDDVVALEPDSDPVHAASDPLADQGAPEPPPDAQLLPLGVYTLAPRDQKESTASVRLALSKDGVLRGIYYDSLGHQGHPIRGAVDKKTQRVAWTVGDNKHVVFHTTLANLTQDRGALAVRDPNGQRHAWTIARFEKHPQEPKDDVAPAAPPTPS